MNICQQEVLVGVTEVGLVHLFLFRINVIREFDRPAPFFEPHSHKANAGKELCKSLSLEEPLSTIPIQLLRHFLCRKPNNNHPLGLLYTPAFCIRQCIWRHTAMCRWYRSPSAGLISAEGSGSR